MLLLYSVYNIFASPVLLGRSARYSTGCPFLVIGMSTGYSCVTGTKKEKIGLQVDGTSETIPNTLTVRGNINIEVLIISLGEPNGACRACILTKYQLQSYNPCRIQDTREVYLRVQGLLGGKSMPAMPAMPAMHVENGVRLQCLSFFPSPQSGTRTLGTTQF